MIIFVIGTFLNLLWNCRLFVNARKNETIIFILKYFCQNPFSYHFLINELLPLVISNFEVSLMPPRLIKTPIVNLI